MAKLVEKLILPTLSEPPTCTASENSKVSISPSEDTLLRHDYDYHGCENSLLKTLAGILSGRILSGSKDKETLNITYKTIPTCQLCRAHLRTSTLSYKLEKCNEISNQQI